MTIQSGPCQSCAMPIESGVYCQYCTDDSGRLHSFEERLARMTQFIQRETPRISDAAVRQSALTHMSEMPAWRDHPELIGELVRWEKKLNA